MRPRWGVWVLFQERWERITKKDFPTRLEARSWAQWFLPSNAHYKVEKVSGKRNRTTEEE